MTLRTAHDRPRVIELDFTSMVDLVFLLVIFFLTTSTFIERNKARIDLPDDSTIRRDELRRVNRSSLVINITRNGTIVVSQEYLTIDQLFDKVAAELGNVSGDPSRLDVLVRADRDAPLRHANAIADRLIGMGVVSWKLGLELVPPVAEEGGLE